MSELDTTGVETEEQPDPEAERLGQRIEFLFTYVQPLGRRYTLQEVVDGIRATAKPGDPKISVGRLWTLVKSRAGNPTIGTLRALGDFFGVPQSYFIDDDVADRVTAQLALIAAMRANDVRSVALRAATVATMSAQGVDTVRSLVERSGVLEAEAGADSPQAGTPEGPSEGPSDSAGRFV
ncbi:hypothetical protein [Streptomyces sp. ID05-47C]|uniref:hypothetical protein n=1 Tax=Streptomyces sp. ID05-47C TaxID=3028665 RepID=UPI0029B7DB2F|nr:hypothetical protein [Streptomyces sp. ID05-47C]MDX3568794.1 hypothetical protein [Streptomyces sp. ID05-47C]